MRIRMSLAALSGLMVVLSAAMLAAAAPPLAGAWKSAPQELRLTSDLDVSVWGKGAASVRTVTLNVKANGEAVLTVTRKVVDAKGLTVKGSVSVEEATVTIGAAAPAVETREDHAVTVQKAQRRLPDDPTLTWPLEGLRVGVATFSGRADTLEVRFDPADGRGAFWEALRRAAPRSTAARPAAGRASPELKGNSSGSK